MTTEPKLRFGYAKIDVPFAPFGEHTTTIAVTPAGMTNVALG